MAEQEYDFTMPQTKEEYIRFVDNPFIPEHHRYQVMRAFMLNTLNVDPIAREIHHNTHIRQARPPPTAPPGTARYEDRISDAMATLTHEDYAHPLRAIAELVKNQVVLEIEKDILIAEQGTSNTLNSYERQEYEDRIEATQTAGQQLENDIAVVKGQLFFADAHIKSLTERFEERERMADWKAKSARSAEAGMRRLKDSLVAMNWRRIDAEEESRRTKAELARVREELAKYKGAVR